MTFHNSTLAAENNLDSCLHLTLVGSFVRLLDEPILNIVFLSRLKLSLGSIP